MKKVFEALPRIGFGLCEALNLYSSLSPSTTKNMRILDSLFHAASQPRYQWIDVHGGRSSRTLLSTMTQEDGPVRKEHAMALDPRRSQGFHGERRRASRN